MKATLLAEAATLGSLMVDPSPLPRVSEWLRAGDFADPWNAEVYALMREQRAAGRAIDPEQLGLELRARVGHHRSDLVRVAALLRITPVHPKVDAYARMVLESSLRREIAQHGVILRASALSATLTLERRPIIAGTALVDEAVAAGRTRWQLACNEPITTGQSNSALAPALRNLDKSLAADKLLSAHADADPQLVRDHEARLIASLVAHPGEIAGVVSWLCPDAMLDRPWRAVYSALLELTEHGQPVDVVTIAWQVQHNSRQLGPGPVPATLVSAVEAAAVDDPRFYSRPVAADLLRRTADSAARSLYAAADNPGLDVPDLLETAGLLTAGLRAAALGLPDRSSEVSAGRHLTAVRSEPTPTSTVDVPRPAAG